MIENWSKFNEKLYPGDIYDILEKNLDIVRDVFRDFEDMDIVEYGISTLKSDSTKFQGRKEINIGFTFRSNQTDDKKDSFLHSSMRLIEEGDTVHYKVNIKLPAEGNDYGNPIINSDGIKLFDDILTAANRLTDMKYDVKLDLNSSHHQYKPLMFKVYFKI